MAGHTFEQLTVGMTAERDRTVGEADVQAFAEVSGDHNPVPPGRSLRGHDAVQDAHRPRHVVGRPTSAR
jgi:hypothetical protein